MAGVKGKSGGHRPGSGPKHRKGTVRVGDSFAAVRHYPGGEYEMLPVATVTEATPTVIVITLADGGSIRLAR